MPPTPEPTTVTLTSSDEIFSSASFRASALPCTSALISSVIVGLPPAAIWLNTFSSFDACCCASFVSRSRACRNCATSRAWRSSATTCTSSPASGVPDKPSTTTGVDGPAD